MITPQESESIPDTFNRVKKFPFWVESVVLPEKILTVINVCFQSFSLQARLGVFVSVVLLLLLLLLLYKHSEFIVDLKALVDSHVLATNKWRMFGCQ